MRSSDVDILMVPGWLGSGPDHWQSRWERNLSTARRIEQEDWVAPDKDKWVGNIIKAVAASPQPGRARRAQPRRDRGGACRPEASSGQSAGAFLVAPADVDNA